MQPRAKKSLGQHFLKDKNIAHKIVNLLQISPEDRVMEIGPGPGALTQILEQQECKQLVLIEKDNHWAKERKRLGNTHTQVILMDALQMPWQNINAENPWKIISNLPYNVASPLMWDIFSKAKGLMRAVFMVQKEVALRLTAKPNSKEYGALSVWTQNFVQATWGFVVGPKSFAPPPKVDSAVVSFSPLHQYPQHPEVLAHIIKMCFQNRRKQLGTIFKQHKAMSYINALDALNINSNLRPENLSPEDFCNLSQLIAAEHLTL